MTSTASHCTIDGFTGEIISGPYADFYTPQHESQPHVYHVRHEPMPGPATWQASNLQRDEEYASGIVWQHEIDNGTCPLGLTMS